MYISYNYVNNEDPNYSYGNNLIVVVVVIGLKLSVILGAIHFYLYVNINMY